MSLAEVLKGKQNLPETSSKIFRIQKYPRAKPLGSSKFLLVRQPTYFVFYDFNNKSIMMFLTFQTWSSRGRPWPRGHNLNSLLSLGLEGQVLGLEASSP